MRDANSKPQTAVPLYEVATGKRLAELEGHKEWQPYDYAFSPAGKFFASTGTDNQVLIWELSSGKLLRRIGAGDSIVTALAFSPNGVWLATGGADRPVRLWNANTGGKLAVSGSRRCRNLWNERATFLGGPG